MRLPSPTSLLNGRVLALFLSPISLSLTHTHTHTHARALSRSRCFSLCHSFSLSLARAPSLPLSLFLTRSLRRSLPFPLSLSRAQIIDEYPIVEYEDPLTIIDDFPIIEYGLTPTKKSKPLAQRASKPVAPFSSSELMRDATINRGMWVCVCGCVYVCVCVRACVCVICTLFAV